jgi:acetyltransferase EpsM
MSLPDLILIGGGEHARVLAEAATLSGRSILGVIGPQSSPNLVHLGNDATITENPDHWKQVEIIIAMGELGLRQRMANKFALSGLTWAKIVHPTAFISPSAILGTGIFVGPEAIIHAGAKIGNHAIINSGAIIEHDVDLGHGVHAAPGSTLGGRVQVGDWAFLGLGCRIRDHISIGAGAVVGMGAIIIDNVPPKITMIGIPAKVKTKY